jgi:hypothetical protein
LPRILLPFGNRAVYLTGNNGDILYRDKERGDLKRVLYLMLNALLRQLIANRLWHVQKLQVTVHQLSILPFAVDRRSDVLKSGVRGVGLIQCEINLYHTYGCPFSAIEAVKYTEIPKPLWVL